MRGEASADVFGVPEPETPARDPVGDAATSVSAATSVPAPVFVLVPSRVPSSSSNSEPCTPLLDKYRDITSMYRNESATSVGLPPPSSRGGRRVTRAVNVASSFLFRFSDAGLGSDSGPGPGPGPPPGVQPPSSSSLLPAPPPYAKLAKLPRLDVAADGTPRASRSAPPRRACGAPAGETAARGVWRMSSPLRREAERSWSFASLAPRRCLARSRSFFLRASLSRSDWIFRITCGSTAGAGEGSRSSGTSPRPRRPARRERDRERERGVEVSSSRPPPPFRSARMFRRVSSRGVWCEAPPGWPLPLFKWPLADRPSATP